jgi:hypothetical protein
VLKILVKEKAARRYLPYLQRLAVEVNLADMCPLHCGGMRLETRLDIVCFDGKIFLRFVKQFS